MVVDAQGGQKATGHKVARNDGAEDGIAVVEQVVGRFAIATASERRDVGEEVSPIVGCDPRLHIVGVATAHGGCPGAHTGRFDSRDLRAQYKLLVENLLPNRLRPELFAERQGGFYLKLETLVLEGVPLEGHQQSAGHTVVVAGDDGHIVVEQGRDGSRGDGNPPVVEHHHPYVFNRDGALACSLERIGDSIVLLHLGQLDYQLLLAQTEVGGIAKEEGFLNHRILPRTSIFTL